MYLGWICCPKWSFAVFPRRNNVCNEVRPDRPTVVIDAEDTDVLVLASHVPHQVQRMLLLELHGNNNSIWLCNTLWWRYSQCNNSNSHPHMSRCCFWFLWPWQAIHIDSVKTVMSRGTWVIGRKSLPAVTEQNLKDMDLFTIRYTCKPIRTKTNQPNEHWLYQKVGIN